MPSIEAIFPTRPRQLQYGSRLSSNHPLSIEAIFPTDRQAYPVCWAKGVTILCQSRLFSPHPELITHVFNGLSNHPLSIEAIFPTNLMVCQALAVVIGNHPLSIEAIFPTSHSSHRAWSVGSNHPLSIEAIFPTRCADRDRWVCVVTILCQSRLFSPRGGEHAKVRGGDV